MNICSRAMYVQIIDEIGTVRVCGWAGYYILGNLRDNTLDELFHNEKAKKFIETLKNHTYDYCNEENCPYMANGILDQMLTDIDEIPKYPTNISLAYDRRCNYRCTCCCTKNGCHPSVEDEKKIVGEIQKALPYVTELSANGLGEFFCSDSMTKLVNEWEPIDKENAKFFLETNGSLFNEKNWEKIKNVGKFNFDVAITVMSFDEPAYQYLSGTKLKIDNIENNLRFIKSLREQGIINQLEIATVLQERNFRTTPQFVERCLNEFGADKVRIRRFLPEKAMDENVEWFFDIRNPLHPYHQEYLEVMKHPILKDPRVFIWTGEHLSNRGDIPAKVGYRVMNKLFLEDNVGKRLSDLLISKGYRHVVLYAIGNLCKGLIKVLKDQQIQIDYIVDAHTELTEFEGYKVYTTTSEVLKKIDAPLLVTLASRHNEMEEYVQNRGFDGNVLSLESLLDEI